jgi:hypothetical protein
MPDLKYGRKPPHSRTDPRHMRVTFDAHVDWDKLMGNVPAKVELTADLDFPMYGNDKYGDCGEAGAGHALQCVSQRAGNLITPSDSDVLSLYHNVSGFDPGPPVANDNGTNLQDLLGWWSRNPWPGDGFVEVAAFAELRRWDVNALRACLYNFGTVYVGVNFPVGAMQQFQDGQPWTPIPGDQIDGGHCIVLEGVIPGNDMLEWITWGKRQRSNRAWWWTYAEEAWVVLTNEVLEHPPAGLNAASLQAEFTALTS